MARTTIAVIAILMTIACSGGGGDADGPNIAPSVDGLTCRTCPEPVACTAYGNSGYGQITVAQEWRDRLDLCCGLRLCEVDGECRYGCPPAELDPRCP